MWSNYLMDIHNCYILNIKLSFLINELEVSIEDDCYLKIEIDNKSTYI